MRPEIRSLQVKETMKALKSGKTSSGRPNNPDILHFWPTKT